MVGGKTLYDFGSWKHILPYLQAYQSNMSESEEDFPLTCSVDTDYAELEVGHEMLNDDAIIIL